MGLILGSALFPPLLQLGWRAPFVICGVFGIVTAAVVSIVVPSVSEAPDSREDQKRKNISGGAAGAEEVGSEIESASSRVAVLLSVPLCCLFLGSMCSFFMQRGLADWAGE